MINDSVLNIVIKAKNQAGSTLKTFNSELGATGGVGNMAKLALAGAGVAAAGLAVKIGVDAVQAAVQFETKMSEVRKTTGFTAEETKKFGKEIETMSKTLPVSTDALADIAGVAGQLGIVGTQNIKDFTEIIAKATVALPEFAGGAEEISLVVAKAQNVFRLTTKQSENLLSVWNELSNTTAANAAEISKFIENVGGAAQTMKISVSEASALGATLVSLGEDGSDAGTRVSSAIIFMQKHLEDAAQTAGMTTEEFKRKLDTNALGAITDVIKGLEKIPSATDRNVAAMDIFGQIGGKVMTKLTGNLDQLNTNLKTSETAWKQNNSLQKEFDVAAQTTAAQMQKFKNNVNVILIDLGTIILPAVNKGLDLMVKALNFLTGEKVRGGLKKTKDYLKDFANSEANPFYLPAKGLNWVGDKIKGYATGGVVPGPIGSPQLAVVHGGETVIPNGKSAGTTIVFDLRGATMTDKDFINTVKKELSKSLNINKISN